MRTPKGWGCPKIVNEEIVEGSFRAHQVPLPAAKSDRGELQDLQHRLASYKPQELFTKDGVTDAVSSIIPANSTKKLGQNPASYAAYEPLTVPDWRKFAVSKGSQHSRLKVIAELLDQVLLDNPHSMRIFSPDELVR